MDDELDYCNGSLCERADNCKCVTNYNEQKGTKYLTVIQRSEKCIHYKRIAVKKVKKKFKSKYHDYYVEKGY
jgi:hypothetical protein